MWLNSTVKVPYKYDVIIFDKHKNFTENKYFALQVLFFLTQRFLEHLQNLGLDKQFYKNLVQSFHASESQSAVRTKNSIK